MSERQEAGFIVKAVSTTGLEMWIAFPRAGGHRTFGPRENADVFKTKADAHSAIVKMPIAFGHAGFTFTVEAAD